MKIAIYNLHFETFGGGERRTAALAAHLAKKHRVTLFVHRPVSIEAIKTIFRIDLSSVEIIPLQNTDHATEIAGRQFDLFVNNSHGSDLRNPTPNGIYMCMFPEAERLDLDSYRIITANSRFTARWIEKRWGRSSEIVYSACQDMGPPSRKEKIILNVGRFFADSAIVHHKRQDALLQTFKRLVDGGLHGWNLVLAGMVGTRQEDKTFVETLRNEAVGYPIQIRPAIEFAELQALYRKSSIYWHATGLGTSALEHPGKQEHLGMSIIEAMSAGAVPVVFNAGGPQEIVNHGVDGFLWDHRSELETLSLGLIEKPAMLQSMSAAAVKRSKAFNVAQFLARMDSVIYKLIPPHIGWLAQARGYIARWR
ncbi:glycosyltransferase [Rhodoplanes sp. Z2-YC6860]|uniref:glycosyltransferase n=1 Tax=Rhodoplanes sp. Z2-YC6860 TaxID=674703 RepID=UPI00078E78E0|nr:glycosyltransferase [Rhodoplanes sp. Z2-YC6860]AMN43498.1 family 2 glycosyl transferase [Rhodoplanes sp. Z2-YC6860]